MQRITRLSFLTLATIAAACGASGGRSSSVAPAPSTPPLASLVATGAIVAPTFSVSIPTDLSGRIGDAREVLRELDSAIAGALAARGLQHGWLLPSDLATSYKRNPTYAPDPYALAEQPLRSAAFTVGSRLPEPLASQLRTMIALHEDARMVLLPVQLSFERAENAPNALRASLKVAVVDPRFSEARWVGVVRTAAANADPHVVTKAVASDLVDLIASR